MSHSRKNRRKNTAAGKVNGANAKKITPKNKNAIKKQENPIFKNIYEILMSFILRQKSELYLLENIGNYEINTEERLYRGLRHSLPDENEEHLHRIVKQLLSLISKGKDSRTVPDMREGSDELKKIEQYLSQQPEEIRAALIDESTFEELFRYPEQNLVLSSILVNLISDLDALISDYLICLYSKEGNSIELLNNSGKKFSWREIDGKTSDEIKSDVIHEHVRSIMAKSFHDQMDAFKKFKIQIRDTELIQGMDSAHAIRNVYVHAGGRCDIQTRQTLIQYHYPESVEIERQIPLSINTIKMFADITFNIAMQLFVSTSNYLCNDIGIKEQVESIVANRLFYLLQEGRYDLVQRISESYKNSSCVNESTRLIIMVNGWVATKEGDDFDSVRAEIVQWDTSAVSLEYKLAKLCLLDRNEEALGLAAKMMASGDLERRHWMSWPVLEGIRELDKTRHVVDKFGRD